MELQKYDAENTVSVRKGNPTVSFNKGGTISISGEACKVIGLAPGDKVSLFQDKKSPEDWYIQKDKAGFVLRSSATGGKGCAFNSSAISNKVLESIKWQEDKAAVCRMGVTPVVHDKMKLYPVITASSKKRDF